MEIYPNKNIIVSNIKSSLIIPISHKNAPTIVKKSELIKIDMYRTIVTIQPVLISPKAFSFFT
jgi:hypothetical protein